jgi:TIR domain-containing protein
VEGNSVSHDVFISYSTKDKMTADAVCATLESKSIRCWIAPRDILPGMDWGEAIIDAINTTRVFVLVFSSNANESRQIKREVERAVSKGIPVIPLRIEDVPLSKSLEYFISSPHWLDAMSPPVEKHLNYLADTVKLLLNRSHPGVHEEEGPSQYYSHSNYTSPQPSSAKSAKASYKPDYLTMGIVGMLIFSALFVVVFLLTPWSEPIRNWLKGSPKTETQNSASPQVRNFSLNVEHSVERSGHKGMLFHVRFEILNAKGHSCAAMASFLNPDGTAVPATNKNFSTTSNKMACWIRFVPGFDATQYDDLQLFMPYDQITTQRGRHDYKFCLRIWDVQTPVTDCITGGLYVTNG